MKVNINYFCITKNNWPFIVKIVIINYRFSSLCRSKWMATIAQNEGQNESICCYKYLITWKMVYYYLKVDCD